MQITDFHVHSKYSRACSKLLDLEYIEFWSQIKGIDIVATGDFTHPVWFKELEDKLVSAGNGLHRLKPSDQTKAIRKESPIMLQDPNEVFFILGTEVSCIYSQGGQVRRVHLLVLFPEVTHVRQFITSLEKRGGKLKSDGRPILGMTAKLILQMALEITEQALVIPAHAWTPWFAIFGSKSGFDSVEECFEELSPYIYALETGLSSDPAMNWRLSQNDKYALVSNSDAHSLENLGREANVFDFTTPSYQEIFATLKERDAKRFLSTIEFFPEEGKYHLDGHADCQFSCKPEETKKLKERCPHCGKKLTVGVNYRINALADFPEGRKPTSAIPFKSSIPLAELISECVQVSKKSKKVVGLYENIISKVGNEFFVLLEADIDAIAQASTPMIAEAIKRVREGRVEVQGGYDGVYGTMKIFSENEREQQTTLF